MASGLLSAGNDLDNIFAAKGANTAPATGIKINGVDLNQRYLKLSDGTAVGATGILVAGADLNTFFGKANGGLPIGGRSYVATLSGAPGGAILVMTMDNSGNYSVVRSLRGTNTTLDSGSWISAYGGGSVSDYTVQYIATQTINQQAGGGDFPNINNASSQVALTSTRTYTADSATYFSGDVAKQGVSLIIRVWKTGVQQPDTTILLTTNSTAS